MTCRAALVLISHISAEARPQLDLESPYEGPRRGRRLLATRTVSGKITWADNGKAVVYAYVRAYDNDAIGREQMGSAQTKEDGMFSA